MLDQIIVFTIFLFVENVQSVSRLDPLVDTGVGLIRGVQASDGDYDMFMGIPYAEVDSANPFGISTPHPNFETIFEAYDDTAICPQLYNGTIMGKLDCLHLNIYVPFSATSDNRLPVMIWVHGGAFANGFSGRHSYGPKYFMQHDVILVTINYRVNAYGFMCLDIPEVPGNQGLKDQFLAIKWVKDNIEAFGGDVNRITLFGQSAGGHSVDLHLISTKEKLYDKVILQSGSAVARTVLYDPDKSAPIRMAEHLGGEVNDVYDALEFLTTLDTNSVVRVTQELNIIFKPCVEGEFTDVEPFITNQWINTKVSKVKDIPVLLGFPEHEMSGAYIGRNTEFWETLDVVSSSINQTFDFTDEELNDFIAGVNHFYFGDEELNDSLKTDVISFDSDYTYIHPIHRTINNYLESEVGVIFYYMFSYVSERNARPNFASHGDDLRYMFDMSYVTATPSTEDQLLIERMTTMWTNFAKFSDPTPETSELLPVKWLPLTKDVYNYLHIDREFTLQQRPLHQRMAYWDLFYRLNEKSQRGYEEI